MMTVFLLLLPMEPRLAPLGRPTLMGPICNLFQFFSLPLEHDLAPSGWRCPHQRLTLIRSFGNGNGQERLQVKYVQKQG
jgi:hypothetical protein